MTKQQMKARIEYLEDALRAAVSRIYMSESEALGNYTCEECWRAADTWDEIEHTNDCGYLDDLAELMNGDKA